MQGMIEPSYSSKYDVLYYSAEFHIYMKTYVQNLKVKKVAWIRQKTNPLKEFPKQHYNEHIKLL
jgi:hypothetical protein